MELIIKNIEELIPRTYYVQKTEYGDEKLNNIFNYVCFLVNEDEAIQKRLNINIETVLYTKFYWYTKYKNRYIELYGSDAGIEQQQFKLIEEIEQKLNDVNWNLIEEIETGKI